MNDAVPVGLGQALADLERDVDGEFERELPGLIEEFAQALPFESSITR